nr:unnamed protein product [Callosobruchus analis]CAI5823747.1 unnamed protein product [Callosobruchus analis]CAI5828332.1 unnamed protein product [Callosobruchus analis]CAI5833483.1 unnamed protein product [Callosobruchus analis]CAI5837274.1 unnamed protein product [Callosobruchus analis]
MQSKSQGSQAKADLIKNWGRPCNSHSIKPVRGKIDWDNGDEGF